MDQRPAYEQLIAGKLEQLPVPDMADAIWARIELQLDIDLPTDDGGSGPAPSAPSGPGPISWGITVVVLAVITAFLLYKNKPQTNAPVNVPAPAQPVKQPAQNAPSPPPKTSSAKAVNRIQKEIPSSNLNAPQDSVLQQPVVAAPLQMPDSLKTSIAEPLVVSPAVKDSVQTGKKKRGVSGLRDEDYRIVPVKKDSS